MSIDEIVLSYSPGDFLLVERLHRHLRLAGYKSHLDTGHGQDLKIWHSAHSQPGARTLFIVVLSEHSVFTKGERPSKLTTAIEAARLNVAPNVHFLVARFHEQWPASEFLQKQPVADFFLSYEDGFDGLLQSLNHLNIMTPKPGDDKKLNIVIIRNGSARYTERIAQGFKERSLARLQRKDYMPSFYEVEGSAESYSEKMNSAIFTKAINYFNPSKVDYLVTIGTQVSIHSHNNYLGTTPLIFVGVGDPIRCGIARNLQPDASRGEIAGSVYLPSAQKRLEFLDLLMPGATIVFLYNRRYLQDVHFAEAVRNRGKRFKKTKFIAAEVERPKIDRSLESQADAFFGFYYLNRHLEYFLRDTNKPIVGIDEADVEFGAVASTGSNDYILGTQAVDEILIRHAFDGVKLSMIPIHQPTSVQFIVSLSNASIRGLNVSKSTLSSCLGRQVTFVE